MDTPIICGGVYRKDVNGVEYHALCTTTRKNRDGKLTGNFHVFGFAVERLVEGSEQTNAFELISAPVIVEKKRKRKAS